MSERCINVCDLGWGVGGTPFTMSFITASLGIYPVEALRYE
jgi:hypothetical protein